MSNEIHFVKTVQKHQCLYNSNIPEYNRKDHSEVAWAEVAKEVKLTVNECKEKWRNIRSSFLRSMKKSEKYKKPYYLTPYLQFVVPFTKLGHQADVFEDLPNSEIQTSDDNDVGIKIDAIKSEIESDNEDWSQFENSDNGLPVTDSVPNAMSVQCETKKSHPSVLRKRKRPPETRNRRETKRKSAGSPANLLSSEASLMNNSSMRYFLLSLLPDFESMTEDQIRVFKIKVMVLIEEIKTNFEQVKTNLNPSRETERLQKRLINLLLKNLQKKI